MKMNELASVCRAWRLAQGLTQAEIADAAGVSVQAVSQFESGRCKSLRIYCAYLDRGLRLNERGAAAESFGEVLTSGKAET